MRRKCGFENLCLTCVNPRDNLVNFRNFGKAEPGKRLMGQPREGQPAGIAMGGFFSRLWNGSDDSDVYL